MWYLSLTRTMAKIEASKNKSGNDVVEIENKKLNEMFEVLSERVEEYEKRMSEE